MNNDARVWVRPRTTTRVELIRGYTGSFWFLIVLIDSAIPTQSGQIILPEAQRGTPAEPLVYLADHKSLSSFPLCQNI